MSVLRQDSSSRSASVGSDEFTPAAPKPATLRKNQACHQCRKQKRKWYANQHVSEVLLLKVTGIAMHTGLKRGKPFPAHPDCVYDGDSPAAYDASQTVDLNDKKDLEDKSLLKSPSNADPTPQATPRVDFQPTMSQADIDAQVLSNALFSQISQLPCSAPSSILDSVWATNPQFNSVPHDIGSYGFVQLRTENHTPPELPLDLPSMDLVYSLVDVFFSHWGFARMFIHMPTFKQRLRLSPADPNFPSVALLHAICAMGSVYLPQPGGPAEEIRPGEPIRGSMFRTEEQVSRVLEGMASFGEHQTMLAQIKALNDARTGKKGYDEILWGPSFGDTSYPNFKESILPATTDFIEMETRKRTFWMAFITDRTHSSATAWPAAIDELDIGQSFPYPLQAFESGIAPGPGMDTTQKLSTPDLLTHHPPEITDDGILYLKAIELLSRITVFNNRVRTRYDDAANVSAAPAFRMLDETITSFLQGLPILQPDISSRVSDLGFLSLQITARGLPHATRILLHDPHCNFEDPNDVSSQKCLLASRAILNLTYQLQSSAIDFKLLLPTFVFIWVISAKSLLRHYAHSLKKGDYANGLIYREEVRFLTHSAIRLGERLAIGLRHGLVLQELLNRVDSMYPLPEGYAWPSPAA
ncbi:Fungal specific transcription factor domain [Ceratobasidium sp. AG-Ba]|nr:Fungal specific transcription factor domain [Ceratobasidium sp. AG-Ba]QRV91783.1 Fungal specific transcription factor domain [Ceratobasidium sp. AG-Ba]